MIPAFEMIALTVSDGFAPFSNQDKTFALSSLTCAPSFASGSKVPTCSMILPSRAERESATTIL